MGFSLFTDLITPTSYSVPNAPSIDLNALGSDTTAANAQTFEGAKQLASDYNDFMRQQLQKSLQSNIPGYSNLTNQLSQNLSAQLRGELSTSDLAATQRSSAAQALGLGVSGSQAGAGLSARNIGLRQYQIQQAAQSQTPGYLSSMAGITRSAQFDPASMFLSPMQRAQLSWQNQSAAFNVQNLRNQMAVQPAPWERALAGFGDSVSNLGGILGTGAAYNMMSSNGFGTGTQGSGGTEMANMMAAYNGNTAVSASAGAGMSY